MSVLFRPAARPVGPGLGDTGARRYRALIPRPASGLPDPAHGSVLWSCVRKVRHAGRLNVRFRGAAGM